MSERDELVARLRGKLGDAARARHVAAGQIERDKRDIERLTAENDRLREATEYDADAAKGMSAEVALGDGAVATIIDPRSFTVGGPEWVMRYGNPCSISFVVASLLESYDGLLSDTITTQEAVSRLRLMRIARAALNGEGEPSTGSSKWGPQFPPASCTAWEDCNHDGVCHDTNCGAPSQHGEGET